MSFYKILPASASYKANTPLTYGSSAQLAPGQLVIIPLRRQIIAGIVVSKVNKPSFKVKPISSASELAPLPEQLIRLANWMTSYYAAGAGPITRQLASLNNLKLVKQTEKLSTSKAKITNKLPPLTAEQKQAVAKITTSGTYLLHGETGSGKTRVYLELAKKSLVNNQSVVILTPEIGLTAQLSESFQRQFGEQVIVTHSGLTIAARRKVWQRMLGTSQPLVVIGPRSALFSPLKDIGLIVIDEAHDSSYKQSESPHYQASTVAAKLSQLHDCPLVLGSATPSVNDYFLAQQKQRPIIRMRHLAAQASVAKAELELVDIKDRASFTKAQHISNQLISSVEAALANSEQALLFLNRRGTARVVICADCGWTASCPHCGLPLTYHGDNHQLRCHTCGFHESAVSNCPSCGSADLSYKSIGSKAIETEAKRLFPKAVVRRFDSDSPKAERLDQIYDSVKNGQTDIIIGTQTVAKGLDLPKLSVVGIVVADTSLYLPDYLADERTYQLIRQVVGRIGRGHRASRAVVQTYNPDNPVIQAALKGDYASFYDRELANRRQFGFPPACHLLKLTVHRASASSAETAASKLKQALAASELKLSIDGPSPSFHEVRGGQHYWQLVVKSAKRSDLLAALALAPADCASELDPLSLL